MRDVTPRRLTGAGRAVVCALAAVLAACVVSATVASPMAAASTHDAGGSANGRDAEAPAPFPPALEADAPEVPRLFPRAYVKRPTVTVTNPGPETWFPGERYYLAYHWLNIFGSRSVWDGLRSRLPGPVKPGQTMEVLAQVESPAYPGVYFLQWDVVREGHGWMSEARGKNPPATTLVIVYPTLVDLGAVAGLVVGVWLLRRKTRQKPVGIRDPGPGVRFSTAQTAGEGQAGETARSARLRPFGLRRGKPNAPYRVALWLAAAVFARECYVATQAQMHVGIEGWVARIGTASAIGAFLWLLGARTRTVASIIVVLGASLVAWGDLLYFRFFGDLPPLAATAGWKQVPALGASIGNLTFKSDLLLLIDLLPGAILLWRARHEASLRSTSRLVRSLAVCALLATTAAGAGVFVRASDPGDAGSEDAQIFRYAYLAERYGVLGYHAWDASREVGESESPIARRASAEEVDRFFARRALPDPRTGAHFGAARGLNVVIIQAESLQRFVIDLRVGGHEVTPNLNRATREGLWFPHIHDQTGQGRTSDAEFVVATSLLPLAAGSVAFRYPHNAYAALPAILRERGYSTLSAVPFDGSFWNRTIIHRTYGFERSLFNWDFEPGQTVGWGLNDRDFLRQMVPRVKAMREPFFAWLISLSLHYPFAEFPDELRTLPPDGRLTPAARNYLEAMRLFDTALGELREGLRREGLGERTLLVVFGDHDAGLGEPDFESLGIESALDRARRVGMDEVPVVMIIPGSGTRDPGSGAARLEGPGTGNARTANDRLGLGPGAGDRGSVLQSPTLRSQEQGPGAGDRGSVLQSPTLHSAAQGQGQGPGAGDRGPVVDVPSSHSSPATLRGLAREYPVVGGQVDLAPTLLSLLGIDPREFRFTGVDLLAGERNEPVVKPNGSWVSQRRLLSAAATTREKPECYSWPDLAPLPLGNCSMEQQQASALLRVARAMIRNNLQRQGTRQ